MEVAAKYLCCILNILRGSNSVGSLAGNQSNPVTVPGTGQPNLVLNANPERKQLIIVNIDTDIIEVHYGAPGSVVRLLTASGAFYDGTGGELDDEIWKGSVYLFAPNGTNLSAIVNELL